MTGGTPGGRASEWLWWQLADSGFPTGGFAHSGGLEAACQQGAVRGREDLRDFLEAAIGQTVRGSLPFVRAVFEGEEGFAELDGLCDAFTSNHVANRASRAQGRALLASAEKAFGREEIAALRRRVIEEDLPGHWAPVFGAVTKALGMDVDAAVRLFLFIQLRGWISSAVRLGVVGPLEGQSIQASMTAVAEQAARDSAGLTLDDLAQTAPLIELYQGTQDRLYSRLFQS